MFFYYMTPFVCNRGICTSFVKFFRYLSKYILSELLIEIFKIKKTQPSALFGATNYENRISTY